MWIATFPKFESRLLLKSDPDCDIITTIRNTALLCLTIYLLLLGYHTPFPIRKNQICALEVVVLFNIYLGKSIFFFKLPPPSLKILQAHVF